MSEDAIAPQVRSVEGMVERSRLRWWGHSGIRALTCVLLYTLAACQPGVVNGQTGKQVTVKEERLCYSEFGYSTDDISVIELNHKRVLSAGLGVKQLGSVAGGGTVCSVSFPYGAEKVQVKFGNDYKKVELEAPVLYDDPEHPGGYVVVHVLPGDKVVVVVTPIIPDPRADLLRERLKELGIKGIQLEGWHVWQEGPRKWGTQQNFVKGKENALNEEP